MAECSESSTVKKRKPNWTTDECLYLSRLVDENKDVLRAKFGSGVTTIRKRAAWKKITDMINSTSSTKRSVEEVEKKWHNVQMKGKAELSDARRCIKMTGGGPAGKPLTPLAEAVENVIGADNFSISGIPGSIDTTFFMLPESDQNGACSSSSMSKVSEAVGVTQDLQILSTKESGDGHQQISLVTLPAQNVSNACGCSLDMVDLHKKKMELEIENLTLRNKLITMQLAKMQADDTNQ